MRTESAVKKQFKIVNIRINEMMEPLGLDVERPYFSWQFEDAGENMVQRKVHVLVKRCEDSHVCWDSGEMETDRSIGLRYAGETLRSESRYEVRVKVWNQTGETAGGSTWFETGLMDSRMEAWEGAQWIGAPEYMVASDTIGTFVLHSTLCMKRAGRAGIVFGANDWRLLDRSKNESFLEGENYIRFILNTERLPAGGAILPPSGWIISITGETRSAFCASWWSVMRTGDGKCRMAGFK